jgi:hypothetical protein
MVSLYSKTVEVTGGSRRLHNEEPHHLPAPPDIIREIEPRNVRWMGHAACMAETRNAYNILVGKPKGKTPLRRTKHRQEDY